MLKTSELQNILPLALGNLKIPTLKLSMHLCIYILMASGDLLEKSEN